MHLDAGRKSRLERREGNLASLGLVRRGREHDRESLGHAISSLQAACGLE
jgi:hypothetical protein